jgi:hypothetical protein
VKRIPLAAALLLACCSTVSHVVSPFGKYDGRWVANLPAHSEACCPSRLVLDVDGHKVSGETTDCHGTHGLVGKVDRAGAATLTMEGASGGAQFGGENFSARLSSCPLAIDGSHGG